MLLSILEYMLYTVQSSADINVDLDLVMWWIWMRLILGSHMGISRDSNSDQSLHPLTSIFFSLFLSLFPFVQQSKRFSSEEFAYNVKFNPICKMQMFYFNSIRIENAVICLNICFILVIYVRSIILICFRFKYSLRAQTDTNKL